VGPATATVVVPATATVVDPAMATAVDPAMATAVDPAMATVRQRLAMALPPLRPPHRHLPGGRREPPRSPAVVA